MIDYIGIARKAVECDDMVKLLEGKGEYRCEFYYYGFPPDADVTDFGSRSCGWFFVNSYE